MEDSPGFPPRFALIISIIAVSTASILIRISDSPPLAIAAYRLIFSTLILLPFFFRFDGMGKMRRMSVRRAAGLMGIGLVLAIHFASWITSLSFTTVASSAIFVHIDPIFVAIVSHFVLKERVTGRMAVGIAIAFIGSTMIAVGDAGVGELNLYGDMLALVGGVMLGIYILGGRILRRNLDLTSYVTPVYATASLILVLMSLLSGTPLTGYPADEYVLFFAIALVPMIFGHTLYNWALRYVSAPLVSMSLLGEPIGATILALLFLDETPSTMVLIGGVVTLAGITLCAYRSE
jgi:drug/metabolite transporter (DMT)-like permease